MKTKNYLRFFLICLIGSLAVPGLAQDTTPGKIREYYLSFGNFSPVDLHLKYKKQIRDKLFFKLGLVSLSARVSQSGNVNPNSFPVQTQNYSGGLEFGIEWRKTLTPKFTVFHGPALRGIYDMTLIWRADPSIPQPQQKASTFGIHGSVPYSIGFLYQIYQNFFLSAEITPSVYLSYQDNQQNSYNVNAGLGFDNRFGLISLVFRH